jgi:hypothetical protein
MLYTSGLPLGIGFLKAYGTGLSAVGKKNYDTCQTLTCRRKY